MEELNTWTAIYERVASLGFPVILFLLLVGNYFEIWEWTKKSKAREAKFEADLAKKDAEYAKLEAAHEKREAQSEKRINELFGLMVEASGLIEKTAWTVGQRRG